MEKETPRKKIGAIIIRLDGYIDRMKERKRYVLFKMESADSEDVSREYAKRANEIEKTTSLLRFYANALETTLKELEEGEVGTAIKIIDNVIENAKGNMPEIAIELEKIKKEMLEVKSKIQLETVKEV